MHAYFIKFTGQKKLEYHIHKQDAFYTNIQLLENTASIAFSLNSSRFMPTLTKSGVLVKSSNSDVIRENHYHHVTGCYVL